MSSLNSKDREAVREELQRRVKDRPPEAWDDLYKDKTDPIKGYDVFAMASPQRIVTGLDISQTVVDECKKTQRERGIPETQANFIKDDFFKFDYGTGYDAVYDYTYTPMRPAFDPSRWLTPTDSFLCALPPSMREQWAQRMKQIVKPDGLLITLIFPIGDHADGPPFAVTPDLYRKLLTTPHNGAHFEEVEIADCESFPQRAGHEKLGLWRKRPDTGARL
ncbi:hypothetical protein RI367_002510 [Sorochytrium milnesiophthora]